MSDVRLPQPVGIKTELAKSLGCTIPELVEIIEQQRWEALPSLPEGRGTWEGWVDFAQNQPDMLLAALKEGYRLNYATIGGVRTLLEVKWGLAAGRDYQEGEDSVQQVPLTDEQAQELSRMITVPWEITSIGENDSSGRNHYKIAHRS